VIALPERGIRRSLSTHNSNLILATDWVEACASFNGETTGAEIVDLLCEKNIYESQQFAWEFVNDIISTIRYRSLTLGDGYPVHVEPSSRIVAKGAWSDFEAYNFCLALSLREAFPTWAGSFGSDFTAQGELFERLTLEAVSAIFPGWSVYLTGWSKTKTQKLRAIVEEVAKRLGEAVGNVGRWTTERSNEAGLDLLCFRAFEDGRSGYPTLLFQCASGLDWKDKLRTPDLQIWTKIIEFPAQPQKAFATPFALEPKGFDRSCNVVNGLLLDRHRLLTPGVRAVAWLSQGLRQDLVGWTGPRIQTLPTTSQS
jgi:hypothetical protein